MPAVLRWLHCFASLDASMLHSQLPARLNLRGGRYASSALHHAYVVLSKTLRSYEPAPLHLPLDEQEAHFGVLRTRVARSRMGGDECAERHSVR